mmetsp:Transcript_13187/g.29058  ORF Transcript_13187/g.29058 Transcript_13187/m.29058 type:complete len:353 (+) Transcript_13187:62-1120(+)
MRRSRNPADRPSAALRWLSQLLLSTSARALTHVAPRAVHPQNRSSAWHTSQPAFDEAAALERFLYLRISTCPPDVISSWSCGSIGCDAVPVSPGSVHGLGSGENSALQGYVARIPSTLPTVSCIVSFRDSSNLRNWLTDVDLRRVAWPSDELPGPACPGCMVHEGFAVGYNELRDSHLSAISSLGCRNVSVVGHSLGGALATLAALDLRASGILVDNLWTFGSPVVGNEAFTTAFIEAAAQQHVHPASWRVVNKHDPVPLVGREKHFTHVPAQVYYKDSSNYEVCDWSLEHPENRSCNLQQASLPSLTLGLLFDGLSTHYTYVNHSVILPGEGCRSVKSSRAAFKLATTGLI